MITKLLKKEFVGKPCPMNPTTRIVTDVRVNIEKKSEYFYADEYDDHSFEYTDFNIELKTKTNKGTDKGWSKLNI